MTEVKISIPNPFSSTREEIDTNEVWIHWGETKEIRLSDVLEFILKQIEKEQK